MALGGASNLGVIQVHGDEGVVGVLDNKIGCN